MVPRYNQRALEQNRCTLARACFARCFFEFTVILARGRVNSVVMLLRLTNKLVIFVVALFAFVPLAYAKNVCDRHLSQIKMIPFEGSAGGDSHYDAIKTAGPEAVPCLIANVTNTVRKPNPRPIPSLGDARVGDTAVYLLSEITGIDTVKFLPRKYQNLYAQFGVLVVDKYLHDRSRNRRLLQRKLSRWYRTTYLPSLRKGAR